MLQSNVASLCVFTELREEVMRHSSRQGKTTLLNIIGTIDKPTKGEMFICGKRINAETTDKELSKLRLQVLSCASRFSLFHLFHLFLVFLFLKL